MNKNFLDYRMLNAAFLAALLALAGCTTSIAPKKAGADDRLKIVDSARAQLQVRAPTARTKKEPLVMVHYMPWSESPPIAAGYGYHWHQGGGVYDPFDTLPDGRANIASHYYPLTGPYDTRDVNVLEYQVSLMKLSGIDGVIFDWYGIADALDYKQINESTLAMIPVLKKAGMKFAVCYEDQSIGKMIEAKTLAKADALEHGKKVFAWMQKQWFTDDAYLKYDGRPVVLCFGPQYFFDAKQWSALFDQANPRPYFISLDNKSEGWADGSYNWSPMWKSSAGKLSLNSLVSNMNEFFAKQHNKPFLVASAFPGFHDIYREAGSGPSYGFLDYNKGETFKIMMEGALMAYPDVIQIGTWNDYGEGTIVEPTIQRGYGELEYLQDVQKEFDSSFAYSALDLRAPIEMYKRRVSATATAEQKAAIKSAIDALFAGDVDGYRAALESAKIKNDFSVSPLLRDSKAEPKAGAADGAKAFDAGGKKNIALGMPVIASSRIYENTGNKAVDGDMLTYWEGGTNTYPNTVTVDLVSPRHLATAVIRLNPKRIWSARKQTIEIQVSMDGETYATLLPAADYAFDPVAGDNLAVIPLGAKAKNLRLVFTGNTGAKAGQIAELEVYGE